MIGEWDAAGWPDGEDEIRKRQIEDMMRLDRPRYFRDEAVQQEYRDILDRQAKGGNWEARANASALMPRSFDEALARYRQNEALTAGQDKVAAKADLPLRLTKDDMDSPPTHVRAAQTNADAVPAGAGPNDTAASNAAPNETDLQIRQRYETRFKGTPLEKHHDAIAAAAKREGIPSVLAFSVIALETGNGDKVRGNNVGGLMRGRNQGIKREYQTLEEGIDAAVKTIANNYRAAGGDLEKMRDRYAPIGAPNDPRNQNKHWLPNVRSIMRDLEFGKSPIKGSIPLPRPNPTRPGE